MTPVSAGPSVRTFQLMMFACVGLLVAGAVSAATYDDDVTLEQTAAPSTSSTIAPAQVPGSAVAPGADSSATTVAGVPDTTPVAPSDPSAPTTTAAGSPAAAPTTTVAAPATTQPGARPTAPKPVGAGTYQYTTDGSMTIGTSNRELPPVTSLTAEAPAGDGRQVQVRDLRDANGDGSVTRTTFRYASEGVFLERLVLEIKIGGIGQTTTLTSAEPFLLVPTGATAGTKTTGTLTGDGITAAITFTVVSVSADTAVSDLVADLSGDVEGRQTSRITARTSDLLTIDEKVDADFRSGGIQVKTNYTAELR